MRAFLKHEDLLWEWGAGMGTRRVWERLMVAQGFMVVVGSSVTDSDRRLAFASTVLFSQPLPPYQEVSFERHGVPVINMQCTSVHP